MSDEPQVRMVSEEPTFPTTCFFTDCLNRADRILTWSNGMFSAMCADCAFRHFGKAEKPAGVEPHAAKN